MKNGTEKQERRAILGAQPKGQVSKFGNYSPLALSPERTSLFSTVWFPFCFRELCSSMMTRLLLGGLSWDAKNWSDPGSTGNRKDTRESKWEPLAQGERSSYIHLLAERFCTSEIARTPLGKMKSLMGAKGKHFQIVVQVATAGFHLLSFIIPLLITLIMKCEFYCVIYIKV